MSEVTLTQVNHDGVLYPEDTPVSKIKGLSGDQAEALRLVGAIGEHVIPESVQAELDEKEKEVEALKAKIAELEAKAAADAAATDPKK
jgi:hypothetical protein